MYMPVTCLLNTNEPHRVISHQPPLTHSVKYKTFPGILPLFGDIVLHLNLHLFRVA